MGTATTAPARALRAILRRARNWRRERGSGMGQLSDPAGEGEGEEEEAGEGEEEAEEETGHQQGDPRRHHRRPHRRPRKVNLQVVPWRPVYIDQISTLVVHSLAPLPRTGPRGAVVSSRLV